MILLDGLPQDPMQELEKFLAQASDVLRAELGREPNEEELQKRLSETHREFWVALSQQFAIAIERSPGQWNEKGLTLSLAADLLFERWLLAHRKQQEMLRTSFVFRDVETKDTITGLQIETQLAYVATMLRAMAIEAFLKGRYYELELVQKGHVTKAKPVDKHHNLVSHAKRIGIDLSDEEIGILENLRDMYEMGRYPISAKGRLSLSSANENEKRLQRELIERADAIIANAKVKNECDE